MSTFFHLLVKGKKKKETITHIFFSSLAKKKIFSNQLLVYEWVGYRGRNLFVNFISLESLLEEFLNVKLCKKVRD